MRLTLRRLFLVGRLLLAAAPPQPQQPLQRARPARRRPARTRDFQRARVYRWEAEHVLPLLAAPMRLEDCRRLIEAAYRWREAPGADPGWAPPELTDGRGRRHACGSRAVIKLPRWARTRAIVLHECAHGMADDQHGPRFVAAYVALLERFGGLDPAALRASLAAAGVQIADGRAARRSRAR